MKAALDVHYDADRAVAACVVFDRWHDGEPRARLRTVVDVPAGYRAGRFAERELPCLLAVLEAVGARFESLVIDGYVHLREDVGTGLGARLHAALPYSAVVVGVAKNPLSVADRFVPVLRGSSRRPLYVSAIGCPLADAALAVNRMHGSHRVPTMLRLADRYARGAS